MRICARHANKKQIHTFCQCKIVFIAKDNNKDAIGTPLPLNFAVLWLLFNICAGNMKGTRTKGQHAATACTESLIHL